VLCGGCYSECFLRCDRRAAARIPADPKSGSGRARPPRIKLRKAFNFVPAQYSNPVAAALLHLCVDRSNKTTNRSRIVASYCVRKTSCQPG
jgi:hypothetical protein